MGLLILGTFWFWATLIITIVLVTYFIEKGDGNGWGALISVVVFGALLYFLGSRESIRNGVSYVAHHPLNIILAFVAYFLVGAFWSIAKWFFFLRRKVKEFEEKTGDYHFNADGTLKDGYAPKARENRSKIMMWISWWPFSALWTLLNDPLRHIVEWITDTLEKTFDSMSAKMFKGLRKRSA